MVEIIVALAVMVMIAAAVVPVTVTALDRARVSATADILREIGDQIIAFETDVGEHPQRLTQLTNALVNGDQDICGAAYNNGKRGNWQGPYLTRILSTAGTNMVIGTANDVLSYAPVGGSLAFYVTIPNVDETDALELDRQMDGSDGSSAGFVWWVTPVAANGTTSVYYVRLNENTC